MKHLNIEDIYGTMNSVRDGSYLEKCAGCKLVNRIPGMLEFMIEKDVMCESGVSGVSDQHIVHPLKWILAPVSAVKALEYNGEPYFMRSISLDMHDRIRSTEVVPNDNQVKTHLENLHLLVQYMAVKDGHKLLIIVPFGIHKEGRKNDVLSEKLEWPILTGLKYYASHSESAALGSKNYCIQRYPPNTQINGMFPMDLLFEHLAQGNHFYASTHSSDQRVLWFSERPIRVDLVGDKYDELIVAYSTHRKQESWKKEFAPITASNKRVDWTKAEYRSSSKVIDLSELGTKRMKCRPLRLGPKHAISSDGEARPTCASETSVAERKLPSMPVWTVAVSLIVLIISFVALYFERTSK